VYIFVYRHDANVIFMSMIANDTLITRELLISKILQSRANLGDLWEIHPLPSRYSIIFYSPMPLQPVTHSSNYYMQEAA